MAASLKHKLSLAMAFCAASFFPPLVFVTPQFMGQFALESDLALPLYIRAWVVTCIALIVMGLPLLYVLVRYALFNWRSAIVIGASCCHVAFLVAIGGSGMAPILDTLGLPYPKQDELLGFATIALVGGVTGLIVWLGSGDARGVGAGSNVEPLSKDTVEHR